jgi:phenylpropionate dioxygenase-like ring-hydroxylating dioxygenase large terminal subunit
MLKREENERITRVGSGTPMGAVWRRYWIPACLSEELPGSDGAPVRVRLLGEDLIAFRDSNGDVGLVDAFCPHRRAPMFFGRNEACGLRCVYHGWKFDRNGVCTEMPSEPPDSLFKQKVTIVAYPTWEGGGIVWTYMGPPDEQPSYPDLEFVRAPQTHRFVSKTFQECNWLQGLEGGIDNAHSSFVHNEKLNDQTTTVRNRDTHPRTDVERTSYGFQYTSTRDLGDDGLYVRVYHYVLPSMSIRGSVTAIEGGRNKVPKLDGHFWIPCDDETMYVYNFCYAYDEHVPLTSDYIEWFETWTGRGPADLGPGYVPLRNKRNDYLIDRLRQKTQTYTGIIGINTQDFAIQEGMGAITDRTREHLGTTDRAVIAARQLLLEAVDDVANGQTPRGADPAASRNVRPYDDYVPRGMTWQEAWGNEVVAKW